MPMSAFFGLRTPDRRLPTCDLDVRSLNRASELLEHRVHNYAPIIEWRSHGCLTR